MESWLHSRDKLESRNDKLSTRGLGAVCVPLQSGEVVGSWQESTSYRNSEVCSEKPE